YAMPLGLQEGQPRLGSLEFLRSSQSEAQLALFPYAPEGEAVTTPTPAKIPVHPPLMQLICMNPPFTRTCGDNLLFGHLTESIRNRLTLSLKQTLKEKAKGEVNLQAGLGAVFIALAHRYLSKGGRLAFVVPKSLLSGVSWRNSRAFLLKNYHIEYIIISNDPIQWSFSENTDLSEVMFIARQDTSNAEKRVVFLNLWQNIGSSIDAVILADIVRNEKVILHTMEDTCIDVGEIWMGNNKIGEILTIPQRELEQKNWLLPVAFAQHQLNLIAYRLVSKHQFFEHSLPLTELKELATLGPDRRQVTNCFTPVTSGLSSAIPGLWGHDSEKVTCLELDPNAYLSPKLGSNAISSMKRQSSNLMVVERLRLNTYRVIAVRLTKSALSNVWWPVLIKKSGVEKLEIELYEKALALWLNSSLGLLLLLTVRQETEGPWMAYKKENLLSTLVLDLKKLPHDSISELSDYFDKVAHESLLPFSKIGEDAVRAQIDDQIAAVLGIPSEKLKEVRQLLQQEPILTLEPLRHQRI
ncbi:MAG: hypothetical protein NZZ60_06160, partial [Bacteroidia bacterium]|nr:hypothetical protein [Bacteroidia bacterium]